MKPLRDNRNIISFFLLSYFTCGIYGIWFCYCWARDINIICHRDGQKTTGAFLFTVFTLLTLGIYPFYWTYRVANRLAGYCMTMGLPCRINGKSTLITSILGIFLCGLPTLYALHLLFVTTNEMARYHNVHP